MEAVKEFIRNSLEFLFEKAQIGRSQFSVVFPHFNRTLFPVYRSVIRNGGKVLFLPAFRQVNFDWRCFDLQEEEQKLRAICDNYLGFFKVSGGNFYVVDRQPRHSLSCLAALRAAKESGLVTIYLDHGSTGIYQDWLIWDKLLNFDYSYFDDFDMRRYALALVRGMGENRRPVADIKEWIRPRPRKRKESKKRIILFAPAFYCNDRWVRLYPDTLRFRHRKALLPIFQRLSKEANIQVIWKAFPKGDDAYDPIGEVIREEFPGIKYRIHGFDRLLSRCSWFVTDCISTGIYDAVQLGIPSLCVCYRKAEPVREEVAERFGNSIFRFDAIMEVEDVLRGFIENDSWPVPVIEHRSDPFPWEEWK
jgi:hypothetical protein